MTRQVKFIPNPESNIPDVLGPNDALKIVVEPDGEIVSWHLTRKENVGKIPLHTGQKMFDAERRPIPQETYVNLNKIKEGKVSSSCLMKKARPEMNRTGANKPKRQK